MRAYTLRLDVTSKLPTAAPSITIKVVYRVITAPLMFTVSANPRCLPADCYLFPDMVTPTRADLIITRNTVMTAIYWITSQVMNSIVILQFIAYANCAIETPAFGDFVDCPNTTRIMEVSAHIFHAQHTLVEHIENMASIVCRHWAFLHFAMMTA